VDFVPHSEKQERAIFADKRILLCGTGIQFGKTTIGAIRMKMAMHRYIASDDNFLITAPTFKIMEQSTLPAFKRFMGPLWEKGYSAQKAEFKMPGGGTCYLRTSTDPDSVVGITNVRHIWCDEAGKYGLYFWENIQSRASLKRCPIDLTTSPYALNWIFKEIIRPKMRDPAARPDVEYISATSAENPYFPFQEYEEKRITMDPRRFNAIYGGRWEKMSGLVYDVFDELENSCEPFSLPTGTCFVGGIDDGTTNPFVLTVRAITPAGKHFQVFELYKSGLSLAQKLDAGRQVKSILGVKPFYADPSAASLIKEMNSAGLTCVPADNDIKAGIDAHYELVKTRDYKVFRGTSPYTMDEYEAYHYPEDKDLKPDDDEKEQKPVKQHDHAMDANRYISIMTRHGFKKKTAYVPEEKAREETQHQRIERLKRRQRPSQTEKWG